MDNETRMAPIVPITAGGGWIGRNYAVWGSNNAGYLGYVKEMKDMPYNAADLAWQSEPAQLECARMCQKQAAGLLNRG